MKYSVIVSSVLVVLLSGCGLLTTQSTPTLAAPVMQITSIPAATAVQPPTLVPLATPLPTATNIPVMPIRVQVAFDNYLLREGPGRLFERVTMYESGATVTVLARAAGWDWVLVQTEDNRSGWMNRVGLESLGSFDTLPLIQVTDAVILWGHVWNPDGTPANYIGVSVQPLGNDNPSLQEHVMTGADGMWYAYLPDGSAGQWVVGPDSYGCPPYVPTGQCTLPGSLPPPVTITLPDAAGRDIGFKIIPY